MNEFSPVGLHRTSLQRARDDFEWFSICAFKQLDDEPYQHNWHMAAIATQLMRVHRGEIRRLNINMPPRTMKSFLASVAYPAWLLGKNPAEKIVCASYAQDLSNDFAFKMRRLMQSPWYKEVFPNTRIDPKKSGVAEIATTRGGYRLSTSAGGVLTGRGADTIIIDDPIKGADAHSEVVRNSVMNWFTGTVASRFNNPKKGKLIVVAQRLHMEDLPGQLTAMGGWENLILPLVAWEDQEIEVLPGRFVQRWPGDILHEVRFGEEEIARQRAELGEQDFEAQYNQRPLPPGGALFKLEWLQRYDEKPLRREIEGIFQSWDTAYDINETNDYSVCTTWALSGKRYYLLDVFRERLQFPDLEKAVYRLRDRWRADLVIVETAASGKDILYNIRRDTGGQLWIQGKQPAGSKQDRASQQTPKFERREVWVPKDAPWLKTFLDELAVFPQGKHDDQVDSVVQFLASVDTGNLLRSADAARRG